MGFEFGNGTIWYVTTFIKICGLKYAKTFVEWSRARDSQKCSTITKYRSDPLFAANGKSYSSEDTPSHVPCIVNTNTNTDSDDPYLYVIAGNSQYIEKTNLKTVLNKNNRETASWEYAWRNGNDNIAVLDNIEGASTNFYCAEGYSVFDFDKYIIIFCGMVQILFQIKRELDLKLIQLILILLMLQQINKMKLHECSIVQCINEYKPIRLYFLECKNIIW